MSLSVILCRLKTEMLKCSCNIYDKFSIVSTKLYNWIFTYLYFPCLFKSIYLLKLVAFEFYRAKKQLWPPNMICYNLKLFSRMALKRNLCQKYINKLRIFAKPAIKYNNWKTMKIKYKPIKHVQFFDGCFVCFICNIKCGQS